MFGFVALEVVTATEITFTDIGGGAMECFTAPVAFNFHVIIFRRQGNSRMNARITMAATICVHVTSPPGVGGHDAVFQPMDFLPVMSGRCIIHRHVHAHIALSFFYIAGSSIHGGMSPL